MWRRAWVVNLFLAGLLLASFGAVRPCAASPLWFDETNGGKGYSTFDDMENAYAVFLGSPKNVISFDTLKEGTVLSNQYASQYGVTFLNTADGKDAWCSGVHQAGGDIVENLTGYDGSYMPRGDNVYVKFDNDLKKTPFTIVFDEGVSSVGAFLGMGVEGNKHTVDIALYDVHGALLDSRVIQSWQWEKCSTGQNHETFFAVAFDKPVIGRVEILNLAQKDYANALIIDNISFNAGGGDVVPEPATAFISMLGVFYLWNRKRRSGF
jgi:hypothetical protein